MLCRQIWSFSKQKESGRGRTERKHKDEGHYGHVRRRCFSKQKESGRERIEKEHRDEGHCGHMRRRWRVLVEVGELLSHPSFQHISVLK